MRKGVVQAGQQVPSAKKGSASIGKCGSLGGLLGCHPNAADHSIGLTPIDAAGALVVQPPAAVGAADDRPGAGSQTSDDDRRPKEVRRATAELVAT
jgi:hypothetical protein